MPTPWSRPHPTAVAAHAAQSLRLFVEPRLVRAAVDGRELAKTTCALRVEAGDLAPILFVPRSDVRLDRLRAETEARVCPVLGKASVWSIILDGRVAPAAVWGFTPDDERAPTPRLRGHVAFDERIVSVLIDASARSALGDL